MTPLLWDATLATGALAATATLEEAIRAPKLLPRPENPFGTAKAAEAEPLAAEDDEARVAMAPTVATPEAAAAIAHDAIARFFCCDNDDGGNGPREKQGVCARGLYGRGHGDRWSSWCSVHP